MDVNLLQQIVALMSANDLSTVDLRDGEKRVVLKRGADVIQYAGAPMPMSAPSAARAAQSPASAEAAAASAAADADAKLIPIKSPMVGTFYAAPKQGEKPYVSVGNAVNEETDVCIIEAMKVFNVIKAETSGTIARVMIQDGQPVEHGTVLFLVKPS
jgi:acetyl-CoA carboxylase biotin carboxyl carrier protein